MVLRFACNNRSLPSLYEERSLCTSNRRYLSSALCILLYHTDYSSRLFCTKGKLRSSKYDAVFSNRCFIWYRHDFYRNSYLGKYMECNTATSLCRCYVQWNRIHLPDYWTKTSLCYYCNTHHEFGIRICSLGWMDYFKRSIVHQRIDRMRISIRGSYFIPIT